MKSYFYRNLHKDTWSRMDRGRVVGHPTAALLEMVEFRVRPGGRKRVLEERKKNVHAFVVAGEVIAEDFLPCRDTYVLNLVAKEPLWIEIMYDPYKFSSFVVKGAGTRVSNAQQAVLQPDMTLWARGVTI